MDDGEHQRTMFVNLNIALIVLTTVAITLRFWSRAILPIEKLWLDDLFAALAFPPTIAICSMGIVYVTEYGLGKHITVLEEENPELIFTGLKVLYAAEILFNLSVTFSKTSALLFYVRVFGLRSNPSKLWKYVWWFVTFFAIAWPLANTPFCALQCRPVHKFWDQLAPGKCASTFEIFFSSALSSTLVDLGILILPLPLLWKLQMKTWKKLLVAFVFMIGCCVIFCSIGRLVTITKDHDHINNDFTFNTVTLLAWSLAEPALSICGVCLPAIFHLGKRGWQFGPKALFSSQEYAGLSGNHPLLQSRHTQAAALGTEGFMKLKGGSQEPIDPETKAAARRLRTEQAILGTWGFGPSGFADTKIVGEPVKWDVTSGSRGHDGHSEDEDDIPMEGIFMRRDVQVEETMHPIGEPWRLSSRMSNSHNKAM